MRDREKEKGDRRADSWLPLAVATSCRRLEAIGVGG